ncbi:MAG TPA: PDZ domain-containing protein [Anaerolineaceae bacterium]|nr:PDZ domain-containing protein [Anaerolineaceae bacterium]
MKLSFSPLFQIQFWGGKARLFPNITWLVILPASLWGIATVYLPILGGTLSPLRTWAITALIALFIALSILGHILGHRLVAKWLKAGTPERPSIYLFGDAAQGWPSATSFWKETATAGAGPVINLLLAGLAYLVWNAQLDITLNLSTPLVALFNLWLAVINLAPVFPFDGGRIIKSIAYRVSSDNRQVANRLIRVAFLAVLIEIGWGIFLVAQNARYSLETGGATIFIALLAAFAIIQQPINRQDQPTENSPEAKRKYLTALISAIVFLFLATVASSLLMTNNGVEAPGVALSVEPMVQVPPQYLHHPTGTFLLTSVIQQTPIPAGIWLYGKISPVLNVLPPEKNSPNQQSPQETARQGFLMLDQSETTATVIGLRLAGYNATEIGKGAGVVLILPDSPSEGILALGDIIQSLNGMPVHTAKDLIDLVKAQSPLSKVQLKILRNGQTQDLTISLMPPAQAGSSPRIGIQVQDAGFDYSFSIPVKIVPQKIVGGPSAGLMFTLTVYNLLSKTDLTGGRRIAGTGTINPDGTVGPIGGVQQKVAAAEEAGAEYFLSPVINYADAVSVARQIKVIKISTVTDAVAFLQSLHPAP